ncbi:uncharacterized protein LOC128254659 isoform X1 [Drosophila gunungcola]|uniref:BESS domain-containing protein n=2 Tax=Drosophila gunungcola TaxID=103775 RepID=A0A9P9YKA1_9MUSC|nr:uncharacterized protein LOC128254659 isoform X1 [Drosophila gunungcola]KAI8038575.1 hypothetical protein M5D96_008483 [Drosophila gunungcola]
MKIYKQKLRDVWLQMEEFRAWLRRDPDDSYRAHCRFCKCCVNTKISDLRAHAATKKHMKHLDLKTSNLQKNTDEMHRSPASSSSATPYKVKVKAQPKTATVKKEKIRASDQSVDYEQIIENLALYEPEQVMFSSCSLTGGGGEQRLDDEVEGEGEVSNISIIDEDMVNKAVANALRNQKDTSQIFGDFVADRLRQLNADASEFAKDKIMKVILEAASIDRAPTYN